MVQDGFCSTYFIEPKKDGSLCPILNLKRFNFWIEHQTFKMETLMTILGLIRSVRAAHQKFLRFLWKGTIHQFTFLLFGLSSAP
jgi:hypothetical protein